MKPHLSPVGDGRWRGRVGCSRTEPMTVYITKDKTQSPPKYHTSANCPMVTYSPKTYQAVPSPPLGYTPCRRKGPCRD